MPGIVTIINDSEDVHFIFEKPSNAKRLGRQKFYEFSSQWKYNKVIILTEEGWYSINDKKACFMKLLR